MHALTKLCWEYTFILHSLELSKSREQLRCLRLSKEKRWPCCHASLAVALNKHAVVAEMLNEFGSSRGGVGLKPKRRAAGPCGCHTGHTESCSLLGDDLADLGSLLEELVFGDGLLDGLEEDDIVFASAEVNSGSS